MLEGKVALVTGGSRGIGRAISLKLASLGADIAVVYVGNEKEANETVDQVRAMNRKAQAYYCDVSDFETVEKSISRVVSDFGRLDILVNNAGINRDKLSMRMNEEDFDLVVDVNLKGAFNTIRHASPIFMKQRSGRIVNISSIAGLMGNPGQANYAAAKAGMVGLSKTIAKELGSRGVTCNVVAPGFIKTDMTDAMNEKRLQEALQNVPVRRMGTAEDIAETVAFLCGDGAGYITGAVIQVDGGLYM